MARRGDVWYAWQRRDATGWDIILSEHGFELSARRKAVAEAYRGSAELHALATGHPIRFARFEVAEVLEERQLTAAPSTIDGARVLKVATLTGTRETGRTRLSPAGCTRLALAKYDGRNGIHVFYCDDEWNRLNTEHYHNLSHAERQARREFEGISFTDARRD